MPFEPFQEHFVSSSNADNNNNSTHERRKPISPYRIALQNFVSQWFLIPQGTGITGIVLHQLHYRFPGLARISQIFWILTMILLCGFLVLYVVRVVMFPRVVLKRVRGEIMETACLSCVCVAFTTVVQMVVLNLVGDWGREWGEVALVLWWVNVAMALGCVIGIPYVITRMEAPGVDAVPPGILLPAISALTVAAGGGVVCRYGELRAGLEVPVVVVSFLFVGVGMGLSLLVDGVVLARLLEKGAFPTEQMVYQLMIMSGPLGQGSFALQILGQVVELGAFATYNNSPFIGSMGGSIVAICSQFLGLLTWGFGTFWWAFACIAILHQLLRGPRRELLRWDKSLTSWSLVFPWGVYTSAAIQLGVVLNSRAFWVWSTVLTICLVVLWLVNAGFTVVGVVNGKVLGLDRGWRAPYYVSSAEQQKEDEANGDRR